MFQFSGTCPFVDTYIHRDKLWNLNLMCIFSIFFFLIIKIIIIIDIIIINYI